MEYSADDSVSQKPSDEPRDSQDHLASDTTDDEQEDLPYDGILECYLVPSLQHEKVDKSSTPFDSHQTLISIEQSQPVIESETTNDEALYSLHSSDMFSLSETISNLIAQDDEDAEQESEKLFTIPTIIPDVLLRHFTEGNLLNTSEFIDYETMPEVSIVESSDDTAISRKSDAGLKQCPYNEEQDDFKEEYLEMYGKEDNSIQKNINESNSKIDDTSTKGNNEESESELIQENVEEDEFPPDEVDIESKQSTHEAQRRPSYEMKYGQGQVHYKLPDFSKVPPKVKIPKTDNGAAKPVHTIKKAATTNNFIGQSFLIQDILDSMQPGQMKEDTPFFDHRGEQALVDLDFNSKPNTVCLQASECFPSSLYQCLSHVENQTEAVYLGLQENGLTISGSEEAVIEEPRNIKCEQVPTEGEKMTGLLKEQAQTLKFKVFQEFKSCLETLEREYLTTKEKHRDLQLQIYRTGSQRVGEFDTEREVEGQIFRLGMLLEDIQEQINKSQESQTESASPTSSGQALVLSHNQETENVMSLIINNNTDKVASWSLSSTAASETQIQEDLPELKEAIDKLQPLYLYPDTSTGIIDLGLDPLLSNHSTVNSGNQLARKEATVIPNDVVPLTLSGQPCNPKGQNSFSQVGCPEDWILAEPTGFVEERQFKGKLNKDTGEFPLHLSRYKENEMTKIQRRDRKPRKLSIFVQEKSMNLDSAKCNKSKDSLNSEWLVSSHSGLFQCRSKSPISDRTDFCEEYPTQKSLWPSKLPLYVQHQSSLSNRLHHIRSNISHYMPSSRSSGKSFVSHSSQLAYSAVSPLQRKRCKNNLDYRDNMILNYVLDNALRTAKNMKKTTERMVQKLATDLVNPTSYRSSYTMYKNSNIY
ncbi:protein AKNAD1 [Rhinoderma darwinii]|uniref:protein AKNAD1 n=1 Tax=Rhinoderma darwinii TaxID=43563 RepID=UPI003F6776DE